MIGSTQSTGERMETADPAVNIVEIILTMLNDGTRRPDIARPINP